MRKYAGTYTDDPEQDARLELMSLCEQSGRDYLETLRMVDRMTTGQATHAEVLDLVRRLILYEAAVKVAGERIRELQAEQAMRRARKVSRPALVLPPERECKHCHEVKPIEEFHRTNQRVDGSYNRAHVCRVCWPIRYAKRSA